ncbi:hypothetical protein MRX96_054346 [Rhipicephalus microplus]
MNREKALRACSPNGVPPSARAQGPVHAVCGLCVSRIDSPAAPPPPHAHVPPISRRETTTPCAAVPCCAPRCAHMPRPHNCVYMFVNYRSMRSLFLIHTKPTSCISRGDAAIQLAVSTSWTVALGWVSFRDLTRDDIHR